MVIWDTSANLILRNEQLHHNVDYTPYEGMNLRAWPGVTISRGEVVWARLNRPGFRGGRLV
ncbi:hypothetical protein [Aromatoleum diolicum]|uniref:hypothetical protein n=1 Tax=Aromatoleum diolicum TaxID=75796 RepID=UPI001FEA3E0A|nr:hypothetical protein [Aromatoleum diolicum]